MRVSQQWTLASLIARFVAVTALIAALVPAVDTRLTPVPTALAASLVVNLASDPGDGTCDSTCTLRDAILSAGTLPGQDTITFSPAVTTPIVLASALPVIAQDLTIDGSGQAITVDGANAYRVLFATAPLTLTALTIQRGRGPNDGFGGGGAYFGSSATLSGTKFISNTSVAVAFGAGGAYFASSATVLGGSFISNTATAGNGGGAYFASAATLSGTTFLSNTTKLNGGGLLASTTAVVTNTTFISNIATGDGGGAYFFGAASVTGSTFTRNTVAGIFSSSGGGATFVGGGALANTTFTGNSAVLDGGGVKFWAAAAVSDSTFTGNSAGNGGGAYLAAGGGLTATIFLSNTALADGGGLYLGGSASAASALDGDIAPITGATFTGNSAGNGGGAYVTGSQPTIRSSTFRRNSAAIQGGAVYSLDGRTIITVTTFANNSAASGGGGVFGTITITGVSFMTNTATGSGGGGGARFTGPANVHGATFTGNTSTDHGGGARFDARSAITGTTFTGNSTTGPGAHGGGAYFVAPSMITETHFSRNTAANGNGGGFYGAASTVTRTVVTGNQALCEDERLARTAGVAQPTDECGDGGGSYLVAILDSGGWSDVDLHSNNAESDGGGLYIRGLAFENGLNYGGFDPDTFQDNTAGERGGAAYLNGTILEISKAGIIGNEAGIDGGGFFVENSELDLENVIFARNQVADADGATDIGASFDGSTLGLTHLTFVPRPNDAATARAIKVGTLLPDENGQQGQAATLVNTLFHGYAVGVQGQSPTSTVTINGVLWSSVGTPSQLGNFNIQLEFTGPAAFVDEIGGDYHLSAASAAIDRGVVTEVTTDLDGLPRTQGSAPDLGAYEGQGSRTDFYKGFIPIIALNASF